MTKPTGIRAQNIKLRANGFRWKYEAEWNETLGFPVHNWNLYGPEGTRWTVQDALAEIKRRAR